MSIYAIPMQVIALLGHNCVGHNYLRFELRAEVRHDLGLVEDLLLLELLRVARRKFIERSTGRSVLVQTQYVQATSK